MSDNSIALPYDHPNHDRLYKIRNFVDLLIPLWQGAYYPGRELSVDETLIAFKGRTAFMQYKPKKPHKWGLNAWTLAEPSGYVFNWDLYTGKRGNQTHGLTFRVVAELCRPIYGKGHHIYMDNYFSSPALFAELEQNNTGACGTLWINRKGVPGQIKTAKPPKGQMSSVRVGNQLFISWTDKRQVNVITNIYNSSTFQRRTRCKCGEGANPNDLFRIVDKPKAIEMYTRYMGGVDRSDQLVALHMNIHKSTKWWKKVFSTCWKHAWEMPLSCTRNFIM